jgi:hypothetical protein
LNDIVIDGHHYDFKMTPNVIGYKQNHIIFFDYNNSILMQKEKISIFIASKF